MHRPRRYNDALLDEKRREVFWKAITAAERMIESPEFDAPRVSALAAVAEACGNEFISDTDDSD